MIALTATWSFDSMPEREFNQQAAEEFQNKFTRLKTEISKRIVGYDDKKDQVLTAMLA